MPIEIIRKPSKRFRIECQRCEALLEYGFHDMEQGGVQCPCCQFWNDHRERIRTPKERQDENEG